MLTSYGNYHYSPQLLAWGGLQEQEQTPLEGVLNPPKVLEVSWVSPLTYSLVNDYEKQKTPPLLRRERQGRVTTH